MAEAVRQLLPLKEWAFEHGVSYRTALRYARAGKIESVDGVAGRKLFVSKSRTLRIEPLQILPDNSVEMSTVPVLLTLVEAAARLGITHPGLRRRVARGAIKADARTGGGRELFLESRISALAAVKGGAHGATA